MKIHVRFIATEKEIIANCPELDVNCYGTSKDEAMRRFFNVLQFYFDAAQDLGLEIEQLESILIDDENRVDLFTPELIKNNSESIH
ncbi:MAG: hypothetical protein N2316_11040 [Spirochaetes bacterium]|nr:hypothetical protein [Spirochaetota bacterium]